MNENGRRWFFMDQDHTLPDAINLRDFDINGKRHIFTLADADRLNDITALYLDGSKGECVPDFIKSPVYMVSEMVKNVLDMYEDSVVFKKIVMIHKEEERQLTFYHLLLPEVEALDASTQYYPNGTEKRIVLSYDKAGNHKAFFLADSLCRLPAVSLEVVESLLRRQVMGVKFREIEVR